jgi:pimeloyl-ACP methyl ester carboxylesterase
VKVWVTPACPAGVRVAARLLGDGHPVWLSAPARAHGPLRAAVAEHLGGDPGGRLALEDGDPDLSPLDEVWDLSPPGAGGRPALRREAEELGVRLRRFEVAAVAAGPGAPAGALGVLLQALDQTVAEVTARAADYFEHHALRSTLPEGIALLDAESAAWAVMAAAGAGAEGCRIAASRPSGAELADLVGEAYDIELVFGADPETLTPVDRLFESRIGAARPGLLLAAGAGGADGGAEPAGEEAVAACLRAWRLHHADARRAEERRLATLLETDARLAPTGGGGPAFRVFGEGERTVVIVNAIAQGLGYWTRLIDRLAADHRVVIWELRTAAEGGAVATMEDHARDLDAILREAADGPAHLVGWCSGPKLCLRYAAEHPGRVASLTLLAGTYRSLGDRADVEYQTNLETVFRLLERSPEMADSVRAALAESVESTAGASQRPRGLAPEAEVLGLVDPRLRTLVMAPYGTRESTLSYARQIMDFWRCEIDGPALAVDRPALIVGAELDLIASPQRGRALAEALPNARFVELPGATHYCMYDRPDEVAAMIREFIDSVTPRPAALQPQEA